MKTASVGMIALLNSGGPFLFADLYTFTLAGGFVARYTGADIDLIVGGNSYSSKGPIFTRTSVRQTIGTEVATMSLTIGASASHLLNGTPWIPAMRLGALDGAYVSVSRVVTDNWGDVSRGAYWVFGGYAAGITEAGRFSATFEVKSKLEDLTKSIPPDITQPGCRNTLFDGDCQLLRSAFAVSSAVTAGSTKSQINCGLLQPSPSFTLGKVVFTSGANNGVARSVKSYTPGGVLQLAYPLLAAPAIGDTFTASPGCDKSISTCTSTYNNRDNFRAEPYTPVPETAI